MKLTATVGASTRPVLKIQRELCHAQMRPKRFRTFEKWAREVDWNSDLFNAGAISQVVFLLTFFHVGQIISRGCGQIKCGAKRPDATLPVELSG